MRTAATVVVSTYENPGYLDLVLAGLATQDRRDFEVIVADDGSGPKTRALVEKTAASFPVPLKHVWQADEGFRLAAVRNQAIRHASGRIIVILDGDSIPHPLFVADHIALARPGRFVQGHRIMLSKEVSAALGRETVLMGGIFGLGWTLKESWKGRLSNPKNALRLSVRFRGLLPAPGSRSLKGIRGCNMGFWLSDLVRVNGFDELYVGWGREDSDIAFRLIRAGVLRREARFAALVYHLWHPEKPEKQESKNDAILEEMMASCRMRAVRGLTPSGGGGGDSE